MNWSKHHEVNHIIEKLLNGHRQVFGDKMEGFYLYGSLIWGDFDIDSSDIDTLCALTTEVKPEEIEHLRMMHEEIANESPLWRDRIEVHYASLEGLKNFRKFSSKMGNISPGEPLHIIDAGIDWLDEWYCVQEYAVTLFGIDKSEVIPHIEKSEFIQTICGYAQSFRERIQASKHCRYSQAYAILTVCRALYTLRNEEQASKLTAARWAINFLPEYRNIISDALIWRHERNASVQNPFETYVLAEKFVNDIVGRFFD
ncbi:MAG: DUF4111 domain-containing protein [Ruminiclostridium sp.]|nr:DUF4111 domain-containing protein [Ruminiclostridium sp.]